MTTLYRKKNISIFCASALSFFIITLSAFFSVFSILDLPRGSAGIYEVFSEAVSYPAASQVNINRALSGSGKEQDTADESGQGSSFPGFALISSGSAVTGPTVPHMTPLFLFAVSALGTVLKGGVSRAGPGMSRMKHYTKWGAGFLDPVRKMISRRAERYDINPLSFFSREDQPALFISGSAGFSYSGGLM